MKRVILVNPPIVGGKGDVTGTGTAYWPIVLAQINAMIYKRYAVSVVDMFGMNPHRKTVDGGIVRYGVPIEEISNFISPGDVVIVFSGHAIAHSTVMKLLGLIGKCNPKKMIVVEGSNFVNGYPLDIFYKEFKEVGATIIAGDPYDVVIKAIDGDYDTDKRHLYRYDVGGLLMPRWNEFPLKNYWSLPYAHAPKSNRMYVQIYTSFGCPNRCAFCTNPYMNKSSWRPKPIKNVIDEMKYWYNNGVREFHIEDLNPTPTKVRAMELSKGIIASGMIPLIKIASGTRLESLDEDTLTAMYLAGFRYLSFSPESGSPFLLEEMNKKFDLDHAERLVRFLDGKMVTQACFILGFPGETGLDIERTEEYAKRLAKAGVDEFAFFNFIPSLGAAASKGVVIPTDKMYFSSDWRGLNTKLKKKRLEIMMGLFSIKMMRHPIRTIMRFFDTKIWMMLRRKVAYGL